MLNSGKKICDKKINILTLVLSEEKILNETKKNITPPPPPPPPPLQVKWSVPKSVHSYRILTSKKSQNDILLN